MVSGSSGSLDRRMTCRILPMPGGRISIFLWAAGLTAAGMGQEPALLPRFVQTHCLECHDRETKTGGLALDQLLRADVERNPQAWEKVVHKLTARQMPPAESPRPKDSDY